MHKYDSRHVAALMVATFCLYPGHAAAGLTNEGYSGQELSADIVTAVVPVATYYIAKSEEGEGQFLRSTGVSLALNSVLRYSLKNSSLSERPNGSPYGFPSGHTAFMGSSAAFLQDRLGWKYGLPAWLLTGYVAYVRVDTDHHRWRDVIAGAALSYGVSKLFVTPENATHIAPMIGPDWLGMRWQRSF